MLTGSDWEQARDIYKSNNDGDTTDNFWYGWALEPPEAEDTQKVTINVQKDDTPWTDHNRTFALTKDSTTFVTDLDVVEAGTYTVYDVTGVAAGDFATKGMNTGDGRDGDILRTDGQQCGRCNYSGCIRNNSRR